MSENRNLNELINLGWSLDNLKELLTELKQLFSEKSAMKHESISNDRALAIIISDLLDELGCPVDIIGRRYAEYAIKYCINASPHFPEVVKEIYPATAKEFNTTPSRVERNIRNLVEKVREKTTRNYKCIFPHQQRCSLTNKQFIFGCANYIRNNFKF